VVVLAGSGELVLFNDSVGVWESIERLDIVSEYAEAEGVAIACIANVSDWGDGISYVSFGGGILLSGDEDWGA
jgi:hypothetical protein